MPGRNGDQPAPIDLSIWGISDTELLGIIDDLADEDGWTTTRSVRVQLGETPDDRLINVGIRLAWMRRFGWLEKGERVKAEGWHEGHSEWTSTWRLTAVGHMLVDDPKLSRAIENALERMSPAQRLAVTREIAESGRGSTEIRTALRRQWTRSLGR